MKKYRVHKQCLCHFDEKGAIETYQYYRWLLIAFFVWLFFTPLGPMDAAWVEVRREPCEGSGEQIPPAGSA